MKHVYLLWHTRKDDPYMEDSKLLGVYSSKATAQARIDAHYINQPGFRDHKDGFLIEEHEIDHMEWTEGYITED